MMNVKELKGIDVHLKEIDRLIQLSPTRTVDRSQIRNPKEIERHEQMKQYALRLGINLYMTDDTESSYDKDKEEAYLFITRGQKVPEELERKLIQREQDRIAREKQKQKENKAQIVRWDIKSRLSFGLGGMQRFCVLVAASKKLSWSVENENADSI